MPSTVRGATVYELNTSRQYSSLAPSVFARRVKVLLSFVRFFNKPCPMLLEIVIRPTKAYAAKHFLEPLKSEAVITGLESGHVFMETKTILAKS